MEWAARTSTDGYIYMYLIYKASQQQKNTQKLYRSDASPSRRRKSFQRLFSASYTHIESLVARRLYRAPTGRGHNIFARVTWSAHESRRIPPRINNNNNNRTAIFTPFSVVPASTSSSSSSTRVPLVAFFGWCCAAVQRNHSRCTLFFNPTCAPPRDSGFILYTLPTPSFNPCRLKS